MNEQEKELLNDLLRRVEILEKNLNGSGGKKLYLITYSFRGGIDWSYATEIKNRAETLELTKEELATWIEQKKSWTEFKLIDIKTIN